MNFPSLTPAGINIGASTQAERTHNSAATNLNVTFTSLSYNERNGPFDDTPENLM